MEIYTSDRVNDWKLTMRQSRDGDVSKHDWEGD